MLIGLVVAHVDHRPAVPRQGHGRAFVGKPAQGGELVCGTRERVDFHHPAVVFGRVIEVTVPADESVFFVDAPAVLEPDVAVEEVEVLLTGKHGAPRRYASGAVAEGADGFAGAGYRLRGTDRYGRCGVDAPVVTIVRNQAPVPVAHADADDAAAHFQHFAVDVLPGFAGGVAGRGKITRQHFLVVYP